jgi:hypothetical protein
VIAGQALAGYCLAHLSQESLLGIGANLVNDQYAAAGRAGLD